MKNFFKGIGIGICIGIPLLAVLLIASHITGWPSFLHKNASPQTKISQDEENDASGFTGNTGIRNDSEQEDNEISEDTQDINEANATDSTQSSEDTDSNADESSTENSDQEAGDALLAFAGDVMFSDAYLDAYNRSGIQALADSNMLSHMQNADLFIFNEEFPFSLQGEAMEDKQFTFRADPKYVKIFQDLGTDIVTVANNHSLDFGRDAFCDTLATLDQAGITRIGGGYNAAEASAPATRTINGQSFAIFAATRVSPSWDWYATDNQAGIFQTYDAAKLNASIKEASQTYDHVIVFVHWGIERNETPEDYQRSLAKGYIDAGADLVVGCHPHVLQGFEYYNGVPIIYSLGNYLFGNRDGQTVLLETTFTDENPPSVKLIPCQRSGGVLKEIQNPSALYQKLTDLSFGVTVGDDGVLKDQE